MDQRKFVVHSVMFLVLCLVTGGVLFWTRVEPPVVESLLKFEDSSWASRQDLTREEEVRLRATYARLLTSNFVLEAALRNPEVNQLSVVNKLGRQPLDKLARLIEVEDDSTNLIAVRIPIGFMASDEDVEEWQKVLDSVLETFLREVVNKERLEKVDQLARLRKRYSTLYQVIQKKADEISGYEATLGISPNNEWMEDYVLTRVDRLETRLLDLQLQILAKTQDDDAVASISILQNQVAVVKQTLDNEMEKIKGYGSGGGDGELASRRQDLEALKNDFQMVRQEMQGLENLIDGPPPISVIQRAMSDRHKGTLADIANSR